MSSHNRIENDFFFSLLTVMQSAVTEIMRRAHDVHHNFHFRYYGFFGKEIMYVPRWCLNSHAHELGRVATLHVMLDKTFSTCAWIHFYVWLEQCEYIPYTIYLAISHFNLASSHVRVCLFNLPFLFNLAPMLGFVSYIPFLFTPKSVPIVP